MAQPIPETKEFQNPMNPSNSHTVIPNPDKMNYHLFWLFSRGEYDECLKVLDAWNNASVENYPYGLTLKGLINRRLGKVNESLKYFKLCHVIDEHNPQF